jgi:hypothetical protein
MALSDLLKPFGTSSMGRRSITRESTLIKNAAKRAGLNTQAGQQLMARSAEVRLNEEPAGAMTQDWREASQAAEDIRALQQTGGFDPIKDIKPLQQQWFQTVHGSDKLTEREKQQLRNKYDREFSVLGEQLAKEEERETKAKLDQLSILSGQQGLLRGQQALAKGDVDMKQAELNLGTSRLDQELAQQRLHAGELAYDTGTVRLGKLKRDTELEKEGDSLLPGLGSFLNQINDKATGRRRYINEFGDTEFEPIEPARPEDLQSELLNYLNQNPRILNSPTAVKLFENSYGRVGGDLNFFRQKVSRDDAFINQMAANASSAGIYISPEQMADKSAIMKAVSDGFKKKIADAQALVTEKNRTYARVRALDHYVDSINAWIKDIPDDPDDISTEDHNTTRARMTADLNAVRGFLESVRPKADDGRAKKSKQAILKDIEDVQSEIDGKGYMKKDSSDNRKVYAVLQRVRMLARKVNVMHTEELIAETEKLRKEDVIPTREDDRFPSP